MNFFIGLKTNEFITIKYAPPHHDIMRRFIGREKELSILEDIWSRDGIGTCAVYGRRQIGKSTLLDRFSEGKRTLKMQFSRSSPYENLVRMRFDLSEFLDRDIPELDSMTEAMLMIADACRMERTLLILDEFPYLEEDFPQTSSILQRLIDVDLRGTDTMVVICGSSISSMRSMTEDMSSPLYGRFTNRLKVGPLSFPECRKFHPDMDPMDTLRLYMTLGGVPKYHEMTDRDSYEGCIRECFIDRIKDLSAEGASMITNELSPGSHYTSIVSCIADGSVKQSVIADKLGIDRGDCKRRLDRLESIDLIGRRSPMLSAPTQPSYAILDPMVDFHYSVLRRHENVLNGPASSDMKYEDIRQDIATFLGRRFEAICGEWLDRNMEVKRRGTWWGRVNGEDVDIDIVATVYDGPSRTRTVLAECKFRNRPMGFDALNSLEERAKAAHADENMSFVLFSGSGFTERLSEYAEDHGVMLVGPEELLAGMDGS